MPTMETSPSALLVLTGLLLALLTRSLYRIYFHPLSKFPGPRLSAATRLVVSWHAVRGNRVNYIKALHERYGPVVRIAPNELTYITSQATEDIYDARINGRKVGMPKDPVFYSVFKGPFRLSSIFTCGPEDAVRQRTMALRFFAPKVLRENEDAFQKHTQKLVKVLDDSSSLVAKTVDMVFLFNCVAFDFISDLGFSQPFDLLEKGHYSSWVSTFFDNIKAFNLLCTLSHYPRLLRVLQSMLPPSVQHLEKEVYSFAASLSDKRIEAGDLDGRKDLWGFFDVGEGKHQMTQDEARINAMVFFLAGSETTASVMSAATYHILCNPAVHSLLKAELRGAFRSSSITLNAVAGLPYLNACINEALRIQTPVASGFPRCTPPEGATICGEYVPGNTILTVVQHAAYRSPRNFYRPDDFRPERWLGTDLRFSADNHRVFQPFSLGSRNCVGLNMSWAEMRLVLAKIFFHFDLELCEESKNWDEQKVYIVWERPPLKVKVARATVE